MLVNILKKLNYHNHLRQHFIILKKQLINSYRVILEEQNDSIQPLISLQHIHHMQNEATYEDMCEMTQLDEPSILHNLTARYLQNQIFTHIGPTLLAINPYRQLTHLFNPELFADIRQEILKGTLRNTPHIYLVAGRAFQGLMRGEKKQAIVISGESGAGKTQSTKYCMKILTSLSKQADNSIENKILACNPILQAFGNSKTVRNQNSSRFGKYVRLYFGLDNSIRGARIESYLLEKSRVVAVGPKERNFHIFYALVASKEYGVGKMSDYRYLRESGCYQAANLDDGENYKTIKEAMLKIGFSGEEQQKIWLLLKAILDLGNLEFDDKKHEQNQGNACQIKNKGLLQSISTLLGVSVSALERLLLFEKKVILKETSFKPYHKVGCTSNLNTITKAIYNSIFEFIIAKIEAVLDPGQQQNLSLSPLKQSGNNLSSINLLDIFGFQNFTHNSLEQLCINFTNQKLLEEYNEYVFENEMEILRQDGLQSQIENIHPPTNRSIINLLTSCFKKINENTKMLQFKEESLVIGFKQSFNGNNLMQFDKINQKAFIISHSPANITYQVTGFKLKNMDKVGPEIEDICGGLFKINKGNQIGKTLLQKFEKEIDELLEELTSASNHFVRCIKPNEDKAAGVVVDKYMMTQIRYLGVFETIKIRQTTFPFRKTFELFASSYQHLFSAAKGQPPHLATQTILKSISAKESDYLLGTRRIYMSKEIEQKLNQSLYLFIKKKNECAIFIQRKVRRYLLREKLRNCVKVVMRRIAIWKKLADKYKRERTDLLYAGFGLIFRGAEQSRRVSERYSFVNIDFEESRLEDNFENILLNISMQSIQQDGKNKVVTLGQELKRYEEQNKQLQKKVQMLMLDLAAKVEKIEVLEKSEVKGEGQTTQLLNEHNEVKLKQKDQVINNIKTQMEVQIQQNEKKQAIIQQLTAKYQILQRKQTIQKEKTLNIAILQKKIKQLEQQKSSHTTFTIQLQQKTNSLINLNSNLTQTLQSTQAQLQKIKANSASSLAQVIAFQAKVILLQSKQKQHQKEHQQTNERIRTLQNYVIEYEKLIEKYKQEKEAYLEQKEQLNRKIYTKQIEIDELRETIQKYSDKNAQTLRREVGKQLMKKRSEQDRQKVIRDKEINNKDKIINDLQNDIKKMQREAIQYRRINTALRDRLKKIDQFSEFQPPNSSQQSTRDQLLSLLEPYTSHLAKPQLQKLKFDLTLLFP